MIKEAIEKILELGHVQGIEEDGRLYVREADGLERLRRPDEYHPAPLKVANLRSVVQYLTLNPDGLAVDCLTVHVLDPFCVELVGPLQPDNDNHRFTYLCARAKPAAFQFNKYMPLEDFILGLQAGFMRTDQMAAVVCMLANLANETIRQNLDDGFSQTLQIKTGLTTKAEVKVQNPVALVPFRTFREVEQPAGEFILRLRDQGSAPPLVCLSIADGDAWELAAIEAIRVYLEEAIEDVGLKVEVLS